MTAMLSVVTAPAPVLTAFDRCDAADCPAQACVVATKEWALLTFCAHHANNQAARLTDKGWTLIRASNFEGQTS